MEGAGADRAPLIPLDRELGERLWWFVALRWLAGGGILVATWLGRRFLISDLPELPLYLTGLAVLGYNSLMVLFRRRIPDAPDTVRAFILLQIALDWLALLFIVHLTGGLRSPVTLTFTFHLIIAAILLSRRACYWLTAAASVMLGLLGLAETCRWLRPVAVSGFWVGADALPSDLFVWGAVSVFFGTTTYLATSITSRLREKELALYEAERRMEQALRETEALYRVSQLVNSTLDLQEVLNLIAEQAAKQLNMKACFIRLFDHTGTRLYIGGTYGLSQAYLNKGPVEVSKSLVDLEALRGGVVQVYEVGDDPRFQYREEARREGLRSMLSVPLKAKERVLGVIRVYSSEPHVFSEREQRFLTNLANLGAVAIENARAYSELQALNEEKIWFARMAHHQLRTPLAAIQGILDALPFAGPLNDKQRELLDRARRRLHDAFATIRDFLDFAAAQRPRPERLPDPVELSAALQNVLEAVRETAQSKGVRLEVDLPAGLRVRAEPDDLERIFGNLLDNAVKYTPAGGQVRFSVSRLPDGRVGAEVADTGIGIPPEEQERIFEGFYRTKEAKATGAVGTGLGLSIVKRLVDRLGGTLELESAPGQGSCFRVTLPGEEVQV
ncbi:MAG: hypothetical protein Kow00109_04040 [Acidobacteriota bacterium]